MRSVRWFIVGFPLIFLLLFAAAFWNATRLGVERKNEMSLGVMGEPSTLNPIQQADSAASQVGAAIFNGLLKFDQNLEIVGDLASSWDLGQTTTFFFDSTALAIEAAVQLESPASRASWGIRSVNVAGSAVRVNLAMPGLAESRAMVSSLAVKPLSGVRMVLQTKGAAREARERFVADLPPEGLWRSRVAGEKSLEIVFAPLWQETVEKLVHGLGTVVDSEPVPFLAEPEVVFHLRRDVRWHDGAPFTARDAAFTYRAIMDEKTASPRRPDFELIERVETPDEVTFRVIYREPYSPALESWMIAMLPAHLLDGKPPEWWVAHFNRSPVGTGPFRFDQWKTNEFIRVVRNPDFFDAPAPWLDGIVYRFMPDQLTLRLAFETRQIDFWSAEPWTVNAFVNDARFDVFTSPTSSYTYVGWNLKRPLFQDSRVRRALAHAVDVPSMVRFILYGHGLQSTGIFTPQMWFFDPAVKPFPYDPEAARTLLAEAGWHPGPDGILQKDGQRFSFTLMTNNGNEVRRDIATLAQDGLRSLGIEVKVELYEWSVFLKNHVNKGDFDAIVLGWSLGNGYDQYQIWHSSQANPEQLNVVGYRSPEADRLLEDIRQEYDRTRIIELAGRLQSTIYTDQPYLFLYVPEGTSVMWRDAYRIRRPDGAGGWIDEPVTMTKAGWAFWSDWFYRPEFRDRLPLTESSGKAR